MSPSRSHSKQRVVVVAHGPPLKGGITTVALDLVEDPTLNASFEMVFQNTSQAQDKRGTLALENITRAFAHAFGTFRLARRGTVVHTHSVQDPTLVAWRQVLIAFAARLRGARVLLHNHAFRLYMEPARGYRVGLAHRIAYMLLDRLAHANILLAPEGLANLEPLMPHTPMPVVPNSVVVDEFELSTLEHSPITLLFVGELLERKGVLVLLDALDDLSARDLPEWQIKIVGDNQMGLDPEKDRVVTEVRSRGYSSAMTGPVTREEVYRQMARSDVFVFPTFVEGLPFSLIEAMAAGLPIVASDIPTIEGMITDDIHGKLVPVRDAHALADAVAELISDVATRRRMGSAGRAKAVETYDRKVFIERIAALYREYGR